MRRVDENKLLRKGVRQNPYSHVCKICKQKTSQNQAQYCSTCAYAKGVCAICGKVVQDISMYKMSEGGTFGKVRERDPSSFKSPEQLAREEATHELVAHLAAVGQVGRMPTKSMLEGGGKGALAATLIKSYGGLNAAADALGLSKRHLVEEAEARKEARQQAMRKAAVNLVHAGLSKAWRMWSPLAEERAKFKKAGLAMVRRHRRAVERGASVSAPAAVTTSLATTVVDAVVTSAASAMANAVATAVATAARPAASSGRRSGLLR